MVKSLPNILTFCRILIIPFLVASFYLEGKQYHWIAAGLFLTASITDYADGYLARLLGAHSEIGKCLDPIADKMLVVTAILMLSHFNYISTYDIIPCLIITCRELLISGLREFLAGSVDIPVTKLAKVKTFCQAVALFLLLLGVEGPDIEVIEEIIKGNLTELLGRVFLWISAFLTLITGYVYIEKSFKFIIKSSQNSEGNN